MMGGKWIAIRAGVAWFFPDFEPGASCLLSNLGSYHSANQLP